MPIRLAVLLSSLSFPSAALAQTLAGTMPWEDKVFGAQRLPDAVPDARRTPGAVEVITREQLDRSGARTLQELLSSRPGPVSIDAAGNGFQQTLDLRGFNATPVPAVAVVVDGVRVNEPDFGQVNFHLIPLETIERVEVHPGPATLFGRDAMAGAVHVTTRRGLRRSAEASGAYGSGHRRKGAVAAGAPAGPLDVFLAASRERDSGYRRGSDAGFDVAQAKLGWRAASADGTLSYTRADDRMNQPGSLLGAELAADRTQRVSRVETINRLDFLALGQRVGLPFGLSAAFNAHLRKRREATPLNLGRTSVSQSLALMETRGAAAQLSRDWKPLGRRAVATVGLEAVDGEVDAQSRGSFGGFPFASGSRVRDRSRAVFAQHVVDLVPDRWTLTAGARYDESRLAIDDLATPGNSGSVAYHRTSPRAGLNYNPVSWLSAYASYAEGFRTPTANELTALGPVQSGATLKPVKAKNAELGATAGLTAGLALRAALFRTDVKDEIYFDPSAGAFGRNVNIGKSRRLGVEWELRAKRGPWSGFLAHAFTRSTFESDVVLSGTPFGVRQQIRPGASLPMVPEHRVVAGVSLAPAPAWTLSLDGSCTGDRTLVGDEANREPPLPGHCAANLGAAYEAASWRLWVRGYNVLDSRFQSRGIISTNPGTNQKDRFFVPAPGLSIQAGARYRWGG